jgi:spoIIIJ-associated protein
MRSVEASAKTRKEAIDRALSQLGVELHEVEIEIVDEGSRGIFGLGSRDVRVRVSTDSLPDRSHGAEHEGQEGWKDIIQGREPQRESRRGGRGGRGGRSGDRAAQQDRPQQDRPQQDRPQQDRPQQDRPQQDRPQQDRPQQDRPQQDRSQQDRSPRQDRRPRSEGGGLRREQRPRQDRPERQEPAARDERSGQAARETAPDDRRPARPPGNDRRGRSGRRDRDRDRDRGDAAAADTGESGVVRGAGGPQRVGVGREDDPGRQREAVPAAVDAPAAPGTDDFDPEAFFEETNERPARPVAPRELEEPHVREARCKEAATLLQTVIGHMGMTAQVQGEVADDETLLLRVQSEDSAILIGRKGRTLSALQFIVNRMIAAREGGEVMDRVVVDVEGYLDRRRESLEEMALHLAAKAKETGRNMRVKPLNPQERRIIHVKLQDDPEIRTFSMGDSLYRSVIIAPKSGQAEPERPRRSRGGRGGRWRGSRNGDRDPNSAPANAESHESLEAEQE